MNYFIFDLDGTLYQNSEPNYKFENSKFYSDVKENVYALLQKELNITKEKAISEFERIKTESNDKTSLYIEQNYNIPRKEYFNRTWNLEPENYLQKNKSAKKIFEKIGARSYILTQAPEIWARKVLKFLNISEHVGAKMTTGEQDLRKPDPKVFQNIADYFKVPNEKVYSIGDQEHTDIIPAKNIGMKTVIVGSKSIHADHQIDKIDELLLLLEKEQMI